LGERRLRERNRQHRGKQRGRGAEPSDQRASADGRRLLRAIEGLDEALPPELLETEANDVGVFRDSGAPRELARDRLDRSCPVGELPDGGGGAIEAVRLLAFEIVNDDFVEDRFGAQAVAARHRVRFRHVALPSTRSSMRFAES
jgi:hypothetical protein